MKNLQDLNNIINNSLFDITLRVNDLKLWEDVEHMISYVPVCYTNSYAEFNIAFQKYHGGDWLDISMIFKSANKEVLAIWPLSISNIKNSYNLSSIRAPVLTPLFVKNITKNIKKKLISECFKIIDKIYISLGIKINKLDSCIPFLDRSDISTWHSTQIDNISDLRLEYDLYLDVNRDLDSVKQDLRKSYKPLITSSTKIWNSFILSSYDEKIWKEFKILHLSVAGRVTRSDETWEIQHELIKTKKAFLVYLRDKNKKMIAGGWYWHSKSECEYGSGAFKRELFDKPIGHLVQYNAIEEMIKRQIKWYRVGRKASINNIPTPDKKEINISLFKQGFSSHTMPTCYFKINLNIEK